MKTMRVDARLTEKGVTDQCIVYLRANGWICERVHSGLFAEKGERGERGMKIRIGIKGIPDWNCFKGPIYVKVELKAPGKMLNPNQVEYFKMAQRNGMPCIMADSLDMLIAKLKELFR